MSQIKIAEGGSIKRVRQWINNTFYNKTAIDGRFDAIGSIAQATASKAGIMKLYTDTGSNTDGSMTQKAVSDSLLSKIYPVGAVYISVSSSSPASFLGGTWERIKDVFLLSAGDTYSAGATGGEATHALTTAEMPSHGHTLTSAGSHHHRLWSGTDWAPDVGSLARSDTKGVAGIARNSGNTWCEKTPPDKHLYMEDEGSHTHTVNSNGLGESHNNLPPYLAVYMWKRIS